MRRWQTKALLFEKHCLEGRGCCDRVCYHELLKLIRQFTSIKQEDKYRL